MGENREERLEFFLVAIGYRQHLNKTMDGPELVGTIHKHCSIFIGITFLERLAFAFQEKPSHPPLDRPIHWIFVYAC